MPISDRGFMMIFDRCLVAGFFSFPASAAVLFLGLLAATPVFSNTDSESGSFHPEHVQTEIWAVMAGSTLKATLEGWARIPDHAWSVIWDHSSDYHFRTSATFYGPFEDVIGRLVDVIHVNHPELSVTLYRGNHVIHVAESR